MTRWTAAALGAALVIAAGCDRSGTGGSPTQQETRRVDTKEVESVVVATQRRSSPDLTVGPASCPSGVPATEGATLECSVLVDGRPVPYAVTVREPDAAGELRYEVRPAKAILLVSKVVEAIARSTSSPAAVVDCGGQRVRVVDVGGEFDCTITDDGRARTVRVTVDTVEGAVSFRET